MKKIEWNQEKNRKLHALRGVSFEQILSQPLITIIQHPTRPHQRRYVFVYENYCWVVPHVIDEHRIFLKTIYPSRKATKKYLRRDSGEEI